MIIENRSYSPGVGILLVALVSFVWVLWGPYNPYGPIGHMDPWFPLGYGLNFSDLFEKHGFTYYLCRLPWLLPVIAVHKIFTVDVGLYLLDFIKVFFSGTFLFLIVAPSYGTIPGLLAALLLIFNPFASASLLTYYSSSAAIVYLFGGLWLLFQPPAKLSSKVSHILIGVFFSLAGYTFLISGLIIVPVLLSSFLFKYWGDPKGFIKATKDVLIGVVLTTLFFCILNKFLLNEFWFFIPQFKMAFESATNDCLSSCAKDFNSWALTGYKLGIFIAPLLITLFLVFRQRFLNPRSLDVSPTLLVAFWGCIGTYSFFTFFDWLQGMLIIVEYHSALFTAPAFVLIGLLIGEIAKERSINFITAALSIFCVLIVIAFAKNGCLDNLRLHLNAPILLIIFFFLISILSIFPSTKALQVSAFLGFITIFPALDAFLSGIFAYPKSEFRSIVHVSNLINAAGIKNRHYQFWFDPNDQQSSIFVSASSLFLGYVVVSQELLTTSKGNFDYRFRPNTTFIIFSTNPINFDEKLELLKKYRIEGEKIGDWKVTEGSVSFHVGRIDIKNVDSSHLT